MSIRYSELFFSIQGEGQYGGIPTGWFRFFGCPLDCNGFGQKDPTNPDTYILPYQNFDPSTVKKMEDLPVWEYGCDSSYSWSSRFKHLAHNNTAREIAEMIMDKMKTESNPKGTFMHPNGQQHHMCWTGGEPLMPKHQRDVISILEEWRLIEGGPVKGTNHNSATNVPNYMTFETNGTVALLPEFLEFFRNRGKWGGELFFSVSPKLFTVSGEKREKAIKPHVVKQYYDLSREGQLKFVVGPEDRQWEELLEVIDMFRKAGADYPVWIMSVGATLEGQQSVQEQVANKALQHGFNYTTREHVEIWGNKIGT